MARNKKQDQVVAIIENQVAKASKRNRIYLVSLLGMGGQDGPESTDTKKNEAKQAVADKDDLKKEQLPLMRNEIKRLKTHSGFSNAIGEALGVIGSDEAIPDKPGIKGKARTNDVEITFTKKGLEGVNVYARSKGIAAWTFLARDTNSPYNDSRPLTVAGQPETREYMCIDVIADDEVGEASDIVSVVFGG